MHNVNIYFIVTLIKLFFWISNVNFILFKKFIEFYFI